MLTCSKYPPVQSSIYMSKYITLEAIIIMIVWRLLLSWWFNVCIGIQLVYDTTKISFFLGVGGRGHDCTVVEFTTTCALNAYHY